MLTPDERAALAVYCHDHPVAVCPGCAAVLNAADIATDILVALRDFCPKCRVDVTGRLRQHLAECTWIRVQVRETWERAQELRHQAQETAKHSQQLRDHADVLAREAEAAQQHSRDVKRARTPGVSVLGVVLTSLLRTPGRRHCAPCIAKEVGLADPNDVRRVIELPTEHRQGLTVERAECDTCHTTRRTLSVLEGPTKCALCRTRIGATSATRTVEGSTYHAGCWDRKVRDAARKKRR
jgi:hypothetical protein